MEKVTFICTVLNEEKSIKKLLESLNNQTILPDEIIFVDGGSSDATTAEISNFKFLTSSKKPTVKIYQKKGNRAVGRNYAIEKSSHSIILCSDAGCVLDHRWVEEMKNSFVKNVDVVAGYYRGAYSSIFEKCLLPYVLVMKVNEKKFLPATRSMAFTKDVWEKVEKFPEEFSYNEDYVFAKKLERMKARITFNKNAVVMWYPPKGIRNIFNMFYSFAYGDMEAGIVRPKVVLIFLRYCIGVYMAYKSLIFTSILFVLYCVWAIVKNYSHVRHTNAFVYLPALQIFSDIAVITGSTKGLLARLYNAIMRV